MRKRVGGVNTTLGTGSFTYVKNSVNWLKIEAYGDSLKAYTSPDGSAWDLQIDVTDSDLSSGMIGTVGVQHMHYDDISVIPEPVSMALLGGGALLLFELCDLFGVQVENFTDGQFSMTVVVAALGMFGIGWFAKDKDAE